MNEEESRKLVAARTPSVRANILTIRAQAEFALEELARLESEGRGTEDMSQAREALGAIRTTAMYDVMGECATLMQKLGVGPMNDPDATAPPSVNAKFIVDWLFEDLQRLHNIILEFESKNAGEDPGRHLDIRVFLLMSVGVQIYQAYGEICGALAPLLDDQEKRSHATDRQSGSHGDPNAAATMVDPGDMGTQAGVWPQRDANSKPAPVCKRIGERINPAGDCVIYNGWPCIAFRHRDYAEDWSGEYVRDLHPFLLIGAPDISADTFWEVVRQTSKVESDAPAGQVGFVTPWIQYELFGSGMAAQARLDGGMARLYGWYDEWRAARDAVTH